MNALKVDGLTKAQIRALIAARDHGHAFADCGIRSRVGGAYLRMVRRLGDRGLLTKRGPFEITEAGLAVLSRIGGAA